MKAVVFAGEGRVRVDDVQPPTIEDSGDALVAVSLCSICASDLHLLNGRTPGMREGSVIGHEFVGRVVEVGAEVNRFEVGHRVLGSFLIACGDCESCEASRYNFCRNRRALGLGVLTGDLDGAQAELVRVPTADTNLKRLDDTTTDERALFAGDILATGFYASELTAIGDTDVVAVIGAGPVGLCCALAAAARRPAKLMVLDADPKRARFVRDRFGIEATDVSEIDPQAAVAGATGGEMADVVIEAVGSIPAFKTAMKCARDGGRIGVVGVYGAERYEFPMGVAWIRGLDIRFSGMANVQGHWESALKATDAGEIDPTKLITHRLPLEGAEEGYELFASREAMKVVLTP